MPSPFDRRPQNDPFADPRFVRTPGMADKLLREMAPLLAEEGIDLDDPSTFDMASLNAALARATERTNLELFTPIGKTRASALTLLRVASEAIDDGQDTLAQAAIASIEPEPQSPDTASVASVIGAGLGLLDSWHEDATLAPAVASARIPSWRKAGRAAAVDILALARKGRSFSSLGTLIVRHNGLAVLEGTILAVTGTLQARAVTEKQAVRDVGIALLG